MNGDLCLLVTLFQQPEAWPASLVRCAVRVPNGRNVFDQTDFMMEHAAAVRDLLPAHVASIGPICAIECIFDIA